MKEVKPRITLIILLLVSFSSFAATTVTIDQNTQYQTIDGFGAYGGRSTTADSMWDSAFVDQVVNDLGLTILRMELNPFVTIDKNWVKYIGALKNKIESNGDSLKLIASVWSPPPELKVCQSLFTYQNDITNNTLMPDSATAAAFGDHLVSFTKKSQSQLGFKPYAISIQNEPDFAEPYNSCYYAPDKYAQTLRIAAPVVRDSAPAVKFFGPEDLYDWTRCSNFINDVCGVPAINPDLDMLALHGYFDDGSHSLPVADATAFWTSAGSLSVDTYHKHLWMTETSGYTNDWSGAMQLAQGIFIFLNSGKGSAWVWWQLGDVKTSEVYALIVDKVPTSRYYVSKNYYKFIRPGSVRIKTTSSDQSLMTIAFKDARHGTFVLVAVNPDASAKQFTLSGMTLPATLNMYVTSQTQNCVEQSPVSSTSTISLPASSIITLTGDLGNAGLKPFATQPRLKGPAEVRIYALDGSIIRSSSDINGAFARAWDSKDSKGNRTSAGVYFSVTTDQNGNQTVQKIFKSR